MTNASHAYNPGYNPGGAYPISRLVRQAALREESMPSIAVDGMELEEIKSRAKSTWLQRKPYATTYNNNFNYDAQFKDPVTNSTRDQVHDKRNKPHPEVPFLVQRLHQVPGFHNSDTTVGKEIYQVDGTDNLNQYERIQRRQLRTKYEAHPGGVGLKQAVDEPVMSEYQRANKALATVRNEKYDPNRPSHNRLSLMNLDKLRGPKPSLQRYLKYAGERELENLEWSVRPCTLGEMRAVDIDKTRRVRSVNPNPTRRGDYCIHPDYPSSLTHHRLNGLSNVDMPYSPPKFYNALIH